MTNTQKFKAMITHAKRVVITTHLHPDADGIGSQVALCMALKHINIECVCVNEEKLMDRYTYLDPKNSVLSHDEFIESYTVEDTDLLIVVDTNSVKRVGKKIEAISKRIGKILFIDHHPCKVEVSDIHCIDSTKAATGELVGTIIEDLGIEYTEEIALPLYTAILIDTSSFRYPTVTANTHKMIAKLLATGVKPPFAFNKINGTKRLKHMQLLGHILSETKMVNDGEIAWLTIPESLMEKFDVDPEDTHSYVNHLLILDNLKVACMFREIGDQVKVSFRSSGNSDVGVIAQRLGGGGHNHSAATVIEGKMDEVIDKTIKVLKDELKRLC